MRPEGVYRFPDGSSWVPDGKPQLLGFRPAPNKWRIWGKATKATLFIGLKARRKTSYFPVVGSPLIERVVCSWVFAVRTEQLGTQYGGSFLKRKGHFIPPEAYPPGADRKGWEESVQISVFPAPGESWKDFKRNVFEVADAYLDDLAQKSVIVEFVKGGRLDEIGLRTWVPRRRR